MMNIPTALDVLEADGGWLTAAGVAAHADMTDSAVERALYRLRNEGKVETRIVDGRNEWRYVEGADPEVDEDTEIPTEKRCSACKETKSLREFGRNKRAPDGHSYWCKACTREKQRKRTKQHQESATPVGASVALNGWRQAFANPSLRQLEQLRDLVGVSTLDEAAAISREIVSAATPSDRTMKETE